MLFLIVCLATCAAKEPLKICKFQYFGLGVNGSSAIFTLHFHADVLNLYMEVLLLVFQLFDGFVAKERRFLPMLDFG